MIGSLVFVGLEVRESSRATRAATVWSNTHRQHLSGTVHPMLFEAVVSEISTYAGPVDPTAPSEHNERRVNVQWAWETERVLFNPEFRVFVDSVLEIDRR